MKTRGEYNRGVMFGRLLQGLLAAAVVIALIAVPVLALRPQAPTGAPLQPNTVGSETSDDPAVNEQVQPEEDGEGRCHGIQRAYWAVTGNPGRGEGKANAAAELVNRAAERGCELADSPPDGWHGGPPPWAGQGNNGDGEGNRGRGGPPWASEGDGPPWGLAWGHWLKHGGEGVCERIAARMDAHPDATVPEDLRQRLQDELGCDLP